MDLQLTGKRAVVTGASRGIGFAVAAALVAEGADVVLVARDQHALEAAAQQITAQQITDQQVAAQSSQQTSGQVTGPASAQASRPARRVLARSADTTDDSSVRAMVAYAVAELGGVDILVNAAAQPATPGAPRAVKDLVDDDLRSEIETKVLGYLRCARAVAPQMVEQGWGRIINVSGLAARQSGNTFGSIRNVAVAAMTKNLADELGRSGVNVTVVHPGVTVTERTPALIAGYAADRKISEAAAAQELAAGITIGRMVTAAEIADVVAFLASPRSVAITGDAIAVGGGSRGTIHY